MKFLTIGKLAKEIGITNVSVRYYEKRGLLPKTLRNQAGYRLYAEDALSRLRFIKNGQAAGLTLNEIKELLKLTESSKSSSASVKKVLSTKALFLREKISSLKKIEKSLKHLLSTCDGKVSAHECPIIKFFSKKI